MLTQTDLNAIGQLIDKKVSVDISAIQTRWRILRPVKLLRLIFLNFAIFWVQLKKEWLLFEDKMSKTVTKEDSKKFATKDDLKNSLLKKMLGNGK